MPTYEYACKDCGESFEVFQSFADKPLKKHDDCGGVLQKIFHARGIVFKGSGFYATDKRGAAQKPADGKSKKKDSPKEKTETAKASSSSDS